MSSIIRFKIRGNKPPFIADLRESTVDGDIVQTVNLSASGLTEFTNVNSGNYFIVVSDNTNRTVTYPVNVAALPTTTTAMTTTIAPKTYYIVGASSKIDKTNNGGSTWNNVLSAPTLPSRTLISSSFVNNVGYVLGNNGTLYKTIDGGSTWTNISSSISFIAEANNNTIFAINETTSIIGSPITDTYLYRSINGGLLYSPIPKGVYMTMSKFEFVNANTGYTINTFPAIGGGAVIAKTINGGLTWSNITAPTVMPIYRSYLDISFFNNIGYVVGDTFLYKTINGGTSWSIVTIPSDMIVSAVKALSENIVIIAGTNGANTINKIAKSINGGISWTTTNINTSGNGFISVSIYKGKVMDFFDNQHGIIPLFSFDGLTKTLVTTDAGDTWNFAGNTSLVYPNHFWDIKAQRTPLI